MQNFDLQASYDGMHDALHLHLVGSPAGQMRQTVESGSLAALWPELSVDSLALNHRARLRSLGEHLRETLLPDPLWAMWRESLGRAGTAGLRLRIRPLDPVSASLPWELIYDPERREFPALNIDTPFVRYQEGPIPDDPRTDLPPSTLSVLLTGADSDPGLRLNVTGELDRVKKALAPLVSQGKITVQRVDPLRADKLQAPLVRMKPHVFHFAGHGEWDADHQEGALILVGERGPDRLTTEFLATLLRSNDVRLVVLNACESAPDSDLPWAGIAQALVLAGVPAVVAMRAPIADSAAIVFAETFYTAVAAGEPLDRAMTHARQALFGRRPTGEWLVPVLFLRLADARLWAEPTPPEALEKPASPSLGGIHIDNLNAGNVVFGDATFDQRGSTFNLGASEPVASDDRQVDAKLDALLAGQAELQVHLEDLKTSLLARFDQNERQLIAAITSELSQSRLSEVNAVLAGVDALHTHDERLADALTSLDALLSALSQAAKEAPEALPAKLSQVEKALAAPTLDLRHKLKLVVPIIPWLITYEGELDLGSGIDLEATWQALLARFRARGA